MTNHLPPSVTAGPTGHLIAWATTVGHTSDQNASATVPASATGLTGHLIAYATAGGSTSDENAAVTVGRRGN